LKHLLLQISFELSFCLLPSVCVLKLMLLLLELLL
jgi:hypothetical protein